jgi:hypothetical protein
MAMKIFLTAVSLLVLASSAVAGTVTITSAGFAALPATAPPGWPANLTWPPTGGINGSKAFTISDADLLQIIAWIAANYNAQLVGTNTPPVTVPAVGIFLAWIQGFMNATTNSVQQYHTTPAVAPPPVTIQ